MAIPAPVFTIVAFVVALGILVFVHELGHFAVAKRVGVKVQRFSIGFGPIIASRQRGETEYAISAMPLGGYVKMLGEEDEEEAAAEPERAFSTQSGWRRAAIVFAGPAMNFVFAFLVYAVLFVAIGAEIPSDQPRVGGDVGVVPDPPLDERGHLADHPIERRPIGDVGEDAGAVARERRDDFFLRGRRFQRFEGHALLRITVVR